MTLKVTYKEIVAIYINMYITTNFSPPKLSLGYYITGRHSSTRSEKAQFILGYILEEQASSRVTILFGFQSSILLVVRGP